MFVFLACVMCCRCSNPKSAYPTLLMYFIPLISYGTKLDWTEQGFGDHSYGSLNHMITTETVYSSEYVMSCGSNFNAEVHLYHNVPEEQFHGRKNGRLHKLFTYHCQKSLCLYYEFCMFLHCTCLFVHDRTIVTV